MQSLLSVLGTVLGVGGLAVCVVCGVMRLAGDFYLADFQLITVFQAGIAMVVVACYLKIEGLERLP